MTVETLSKWFKEHHPKYEISILKKGDIYEAAITTDYYKYDDNKIAFIVRSKRLKNLKTSVLECITPEPVKYAI